MEEKKLILFLFSVGKRCKSNSVRDVAGLEHYLQQRDNGRSPTQSRRNELLFLFVKTCKRKSFPHVPTVDAQQPPTSLQEKHHLTTARSK
jgi:hypothetical protein